MEITKGNTALMKKTLSPGSWVGMTLICALFGLVAPAQENQKPQTAIPQIKAVEAREHLGQQAVVTGTVAEVSKTERVVRLNLEKPFPKQIFTAVVFPKNTNAFGDLEKLKGKRVEISGKITEYRGLPEIVLISTNQLKVAEELGEKK